MATITIHKAKTQLSALLREVEEGKEFVIARGKKPVARLVPVQAEKRQRKPGALKGKLVVGPEFFEPLPDDELQAWES